MQESNEKHSGEFHQYTEQLKGEGEGLESHTHELLCPDTKKGENEQTWPQHPKDTNIRMLYIMVEQHVSIQAVEETSKHQRAWSIGDIRAENFPRQEEMDGQ